MVALSFIGTGEYSETIYSYKNAEVTTKFFPFALHKFIKPDKFFVIMTEKAKIKHADELHRNCNFKEILIPEGKSETEIWEIFDAISSEIKENDHVIFDITHGFRSQPIIVIALLQYLRALKNIYIENILYGAFEARDENNVAPVFELKSFMDLIDWSNAVHEFTINGNMKYLSDLLRKIHNNSNISKISTPSKQLKGAGNDLADLTDAFSTIRLNEVFNSTAKFNGRVDSLKTDLINNPTAKPFAKLIDIILKKFDSITKADKSIFSEKGIEAQKTILTWYLETEKYQKAITLAREFIVTKYLIEFEKTDRGCLLEKACRYFAEEELGKMIPLLKKREKFAGRKREYAKIWQKITDTRNDINHAGMRKNPTPAKNLIKQIKFIIEKIDRDF